MIRRVLYICIAMLIVSGSSSLNAGNLSAYDYITAVRSRYEQIEDYQCRMHEFSIGDGKREERIINYFFKKPHMIRIDILDGNKARDRGSVGVFTGGERVSGHRGGFMKRMVMSVNKDSPLALSVRGETIEQSNVLAVIERMEHLVQCGTVNFEELDTHIELSFIPFDAAENGGITRDVVWIQRHTMLIIKIQRYEGEILVQQAIRERYIINAGLPLELFDAHYETEQLQASGIPHLTNDLHGYSITP